MFLLLYFLYSPIWCDKNQSSSLLSLSISSIAIELRKKKMRRTTRKTGQPNSTSVNSSAVDLFRSGIWFFFLFLFQNSNSSTCDYRHGNRSSCCVCVVVNRVLHAWLITFLMVLFKEICVFLILRVELY